MIDILQDGDVTDVSALICDCYRYLAEVDGYSENQLADMICRRGTVTVLSSHLNMYDNFVYRQDSEVIGMVSVRQNELAKLYVKISHHKQGIGRKLFLYAEELIGTQFSDMFLGAFDSAIPFYEKMGMQIKKWKIIGCGPLKGKKQAIMSKLL